jgi:hypothetical protein
MWQRVTRRELSMGDRPHTADSTDRFDDRTHSDAARATNAPDLRLAVVEYDERSDRGTIHPPNLTGIARMETWLSANMSAVVDLSTWR